jgi:hypothetical protein
MEISVGRTQVAAVFGFFIASRGRVTRAYLLLTLDTYICFGVFEVRGEDIYRFKANAQV